MKCFSLTPSVPGSTMNNLTIATQHYIGTTGCRLWTADRRLKTKF